MCKNNYTLKTNSILKRECQKTINPSFLLKIRK